MAFPWLNNGVDPNYLLYNWDDPPSKVLSDVGHSSPRHQSTVFPKRPTVFDLVSILSGKTSFCLQELVLKRT